MVTTPLIEFSSYNLVNCTMNALLLRRLSIVLVQLGNWWIWFQSSQIKQASSSTVRLTAYEWLRVTYSPWDMDHAVQESETRKNIMPRKIAGGSAFMTVRVPGWTILMTYCSWCQPCVCVPCAEATSCGSPVKCCCCCVPSTQGHSCITQQHCGGSAAA